MLKNEVRRSLRLRNGKKCDGLVDGCDNSDSATKTYQSAIAKHLSMNIECAKAFCDDCFSVLSRARSRRHLEVLESVYVHVQRPISYVFKKKLSNHCCYLSLTLHVFVSRYCFVVLVL